jgi:E3 ubiquitin-protein ligase RGLG
VSLSGPSSLAPIVNKAVDVVRLTRKYHILVIVTDGQITEDSASIAAIVNASNVPLSIIAVGVGDGPWDTLQKFDSCLARRRFDNFRFVDYHRATAKTKNPDMAFALQALMEIPDQYKRIKELGYLDGRGMLIKAGNSNLCGSSPDSSEGKLASCGAEMVKCAPQTVPEGIRHRFSTMSF